MNTGGMQTCPRCSGAIFPPGSTAGWGGQICRCGTLYDAQNGPQVPPYSWPVGPPNTFPHVLREQAIAEKLDRIINILERIYGEQK